MQHNRRPPPTRPAAPNLPQVWDANTLACLATLTGHTMRVLYLAVSPDGQTIVTGGFKKWVDAVGGWVGGRQAGRQVGGKRGGVRGGDRRACGAHTHHWRWLTCCPLAMPSAVCAGAGDETLRFWNVFPGPKAQGSGSDSGMGSMMRTLIR